MQSLPAWTKQHRDTSKVVHRLSIKVQNARGWQHLHTTSCRINILFNLCLRNSTFSALPPNSNFCYIVLVIRSPPPPVDLFIASWLVQSSTVLLRAATTKLASAARTVFCLIKRFDQYICINSSSSSRILNIRHDRFPTRRLCLCLLFFLQRY